MSYKIEGIIQEMQCDAFGKLTGLKIKGSDGYLLKQGDKEYNVFYPEEMPSREDTASKNALIVSAETELSFASTLDVALHQILVQAKCVNKKIRLAVLCYSAVTGDAISLGNVIVESITIL